MNKRFEPQIENEALKELPQLMFNGELITVDSKEMLEEVAPEIARHNIVGFDTETKPSFKKGVRNKVSLIQISTEDKCYLIRVQKTGINETLRTWFQDDSITKIGLSLRDDFRELRHFQKIDLRGFIDLQEIASKYGVLELSLRKMSALVLGGRISKRQQLTNWENQVLTEGQKQYAATDAWACLKIYQKFTLKK